MRCAVRCCGTCDYCMPKDAYDEDGEPSDEAMGLCDDLDAIVYLSTPACDSWREGCDD